MELVGRAIARRHQIGHTVRRQQVRLDPGEIEIVADNPVDHHSRAIFDLQRAIDANPYPLANRVLRSDAREMQAIRHIDVGGFDDLFGNHRCLDLEQDIGRLERVIIEIGFDRELHG